ncbi:OmpA family protein [Cryptosporangium arvum]|uniref:OmpA family protein n=1 Tax=Cryptosporangium arvum TaxID=80871 RepID=UPI0004B96D02|nr:OmpA family protein [Cryptosporangium arvum]
MFIPAHEHPIRALVRAAALPLALGAALTFPTAATAEPPPAPGQAGGPMAGEPVGGPMAGEPAVEPMAGEPAVEPMTGEPAVEPMTEPWVEPAPPPAPDELTTSLGPIGLALPGQQLTLVGTGFRPGETTQATADPATATATALGTAIASGAGEVSLTVTLPTGLDVGDHTVVLTGAEVTRTLHVLTPPTALTSNGPDVQAVALPIPAGGWVTLLDAKEEPVTQVSSRDQGLYSIDPSTGRVTFAPKSMFWGAVRPVHFRISDAVGQTVQGTWTPAVDARPLPSVRTAERTLTDASGGTARIGCTAGPIAVVTCEATLTAVVGSEDVVLGTGTGQTATPVVGTRVADVTLTEQGRRLAGRPGGIAAEVSVRMWVPDRPEPFEATGETVLTALTVTAPRTIRYPAGGLDVPEADLPYLNALRSRLTDVTAVTCTGGTDDQGDAETNRQVAEDRARRVCEYLTANTISGQVRAVVRSVGEDDPVADNTTEEGRTRNRRVEIAFSYAAEPSS